MGGLPALATTLVRGGVACFPRHGHSGPPCSPLPPSASRPRGGWAEIESFPIRPSRRGPPAVADRPTPPGAPPPLLPTADPGARLGPRRRRAATPPSHRRASRSARAERRAGGCDRLPSGSPRSGQPLGGPRRRAGRESSTHRRNPLRQAVQAGHGDHGQFFASRYPAASASAAPERHPVSSRYVRIVRTVRTRW
jgi:hypothetical protein